MNTLFTRILCILTISITLHLQASEAEFKNKQEKIAPAGRFRGPAALARAVVHNEYDKVEKLLKNGVNPNEVSYDGEPITVVTIKLSISSSIHEKMLNLLLAHKATVNYYGEEPFVIAANKPSVLELLLNYAEISFTGDFLYRLISPYTIFTLSQNRTTSAALVMNRPEINDTSVEEAYKYIEEETQIRCILWNHGNQKHAIEARRILDEARIKNYHHRVAQVTSKILEINPVDKAPIILPPLAKIIAQYGAEYHCMQTRPLAITLES